LDLSDPITTYNLPGLGFIWGGTNYGDNTLESNTSEETSVTIEGNSDGTYLNVVLDTMTAPDSNHAHPSYGTIEIVSVEQTSEP
jgi:hypothetical protein